MRTFGKLKIILIAMLVAASFAMLACGDGKKENEPTPSAVPASVAFAQSTAYFTSADHAIRPIVGISPGEGEAVDKAITVKISGVETVGLALEFAGSAPDGLLYSVNSGEAHAFESGDIFSAAVDARATEKHMRLMIWLAPDADGDLADSSFTFTIVAKGKVHGSNTWDKTASMAGNTVTGATPDAYEWTAAAQKAAASGIAVTTLDGHYDGEPIDLTALFEEPRLSATFTPTGGAEAAVENPAQFAPVTSGTLTVRQENGWFVASPLTAQVTAEASFMVPFNVAYPAWYHETDDTITVTATGSTTTTVTAEPAESGYTVKLKNGAYTSLSFTSARFRASETAESATLANITVSGGADLTGETISFTLPKLGAADRGVQNETAPPTYNETGFTIVANENKKGIYYPLAGVTATEGFVIRYTYVSTGTGWYGGGFCFRMGGYWYTIIPYAASNGGTSLLRVVLCRSTAGTKLSGVEFASAYLPPVSASTPALSAGATLNVTIAYCDDAYYLRVNDACAVRISEVLFSTERLCNATGGVDGGGCQIFLGDTNDAYNNIVKSIGGENGIAAFLGAGDRTLGFRSVDRNDTFTNIQYALGNEAAKETIAAMHELAKTKTQFRICEHNPWPAWLEEGEEATLLIKPLEAILPGKDEESSERE